MRLSIAIIYAPNRWNKRKPGRIGKLTELFSSRIPQAVRDIAFGFCLMGVAVFKQGAVRQAPLFKHVRAYAQESVLRLLGDVMKQIDEDNTISIFNKGGFSHVYPIK